ncbi:hypothetical protein O181_072934, partial [Austropuccinia psidii MF-1]|nr:hypothetical protein [Austropuccinia psidii MF-1]
MRQIHPLPPPPNKFINFLKQGNVLIRVKDEGEKPFQNLGAEQIAKKVEEALEKVQASVNGEKITIKSVIKYKSGDIRFFTKNKAQASWILENRHTWTHLADPLFVTSQALFPVLLHSIPTFFNVEDETDIPEFCEENFILRDNIKKMKWIGDPVAQQKSNGSMIIHLSDKELAKELIKGNLAYKRTHIKPSAFQAGPPQCYNCLKIGHIAHFCKNKPTCPNCWKDHNTKSCNKANSEGLCVRCVKADLDAEAPIDMNDDNQAQSNQRIRLTGRFSNTTIRLNPTNLHHQFSILQLNCHNQKDTTLSALNNEQQHIALLFQEPWVYHHDFQPPTHQAWRRLTPITNPTTWSERPQTYIYIHNFVPLKNITFSNTNLQNLTQVAIDILLKGINQKLTFLALYNPPCTFSELQELDQRLLEMDTRLHPMVIAMDSNLHHWLWNPKKYHHQHPQARNLLEICGRKGFKLILPKGEPTFMGAFGSATTIDLTWANTIANKIISKCKVQLENHSSDHQPIVCKFN